MQSDLAICKLNYSRKTAECSYSTSTIKDPLESFTYYINWISFRRSCSHQVYDDDRALFGPWGVAVYCTQPASVDGFDLRVIL